MIQKLRSLFHIKYIQNSLWLAILQFFNTVVPFVTLPYITRVLGTDKYGVFSLALNWVLYFQVFVEYGFGYTGARRVSLDNGKTKQLLFSKIITARLLLFCLSAVLVVIVSFAFHATEEQFICMAILFLMILGVAFQLTWLFQGMQEMKLITIINATSRLISVILVFIAVHGVNDLYLYCFCYSATFVVSALIGIIYAMHHYGLKLKLCSVPEAIDEVKDGWYIFISQAMAKVFSGIGTTVLGQVASKSIVGVYSAIYKIPYIMVLLFSPISQAIYPYLSKSYTISIDEGILQVKKISKYVLGFFSVLMLVIILLRNPIANIAFGNDYSDYAIIVLPLSIWFLLSIMNNFLGIQILVASGKQKEYSRCFSISAGASVLLNIFLGKLFSIYGVACAAPVGEGVLTLLLYRCVRKNYGK